MAFTPDLSEILQTTGGTWRVFFYATDDSKDTLLADGYFTHVDRWGVRAGDLIFVLSSVETDEFSLKVDAVSAIGTATVHEQGSGGEQTAFIEDFGSSVGLGNITRDTEAFQAAMVEGIAIYGRDSTPFYYIGEGVTITGAGSYLKNARIKVALGLLGFSSTDSSAATRYDPQHCLLNWSSANGGGGYEDLEISGDGGGDFVCCPLAVNAGMTTKPFVGRGRLYIHDMPLVTAGLALNGVGYEAYDIDTIEINNFGTAQPISYWVGTAASFVQTTGVWIDDSGTSKRGRIGTVRGKNGLLTGAAYVAHGQQSDGVTIAGADLANDKGPIITHIEFDQVGEACDSFGRGADIGTIIGRNCEFYVAKFIHGARFNRYGRVHGENTGIAIAIFSGSNSVGVGDTENNSIASLTGYDHGNYIILSGTAGAATATTLVLPVGAVAIDDYYNAKRLKITSGAHAQEVTITDYVGSTRVATVAAWTNGTPSDTPTCKVIPNPDRPAVLFALDGSGGSPRNNTVTIDGVHNGGDLLSIVKSSLTDTTDNNRAIINRDLGSQTAICAFAANGPVRVMPGPANRSVVRLGIGVAQDVSDTSAHTLPFNTRREDTYTRPAGSNQQSSLASSENGPRIACPGNKIATIALRGLGGANGRIDVSLKRGSNILVTESWVPNGTGSQNWTTSFPFYHQETWFGSDENLYTVEVTHADATLWQYSTVSYFAISDA